MTGRVEKAGTGSGRMVVGGRGTASERTNRRERGGMEGSLVMGAREGQRVGEKMPREE